MTHLSRYFFASLVVAAVLWPGVAPIRAYDQPQTATPPASLRFRHLTPDDGLPSNMVSAIVQDGLGFMWFGTNEGLASYDGYRVRVYRPDADDPTSLAGEAVAALAEDAAGALWVGTRDGGLSRLDPRALTFSHYELPSPHPDRPIPVGITALALDPAGMLWVGAADGRLLRRDSGTDRVAQVELPPCGKLGSLKKIVVGSSGVLWALGSGVWRVDPVANAVTCQLDLTNSRTVFNDLLPDGAGQLWLAGSDGLYRLDLQNGQLQRVPLKLTASPGSLIPPDAPTGPITALHQDNNGWLWLGTVVNGLAMFDPQTEQVVAQYLHNASDLNSLSNAAATTITRSDDGVIWIGTAFAGVDRVNLQQAQFGFRRGDPLSENSFLDRPMRALAEDAQGIIWAGAAHFLTRFDPATKRFQHFDPHAGPRPPGSPHAVDINRIIPDGNGGVWFDGVNGITHFAGTTARFQNYRPADQGKKPFAIWDLADDGRGSLWAVAENDPTLYRFDLASHQFTQFLPPAAEAKTALRSVSNGLDGEIWVGGDGVLGQLNPANGEFRYHRHDPNNTSSLSASQITSIMVDRAGDLWLTGDKGLDHFARARGQVRHYTRAEGLPSNIVRCVQQGANGHVWGSTTSGLARIEPDSGRIRTYQASDGLQDNDFSEGCAKSPAGQLLFGGKNGLNRFDPTQIRDSDYQPPVVLTDLTLFNHPVPIGDTSILQAPIWETQQISLQRDQNVLSLEFAALGYTAPERQRYRYRLAGVDQEWNNVDSSRRFVTYTSLPPGTYQFEVEGTNHNGVWSNQRAALRITVAPAWWETWWFRVLAMIVVMSAAAAGYRARMASFTRRSQALERVVAERTGELQTEVRERRHAELALRKANGELQRLAVLDALTQVANRRRFDDYLHLQLAQPDRPALSLLLCDVDHFKLYNDGYGHPAGDRCLQQIAQSISGSLRHINDLVARYGGEEFVVVLPDTNLDEARQVAAMIQNRLRAAAIPHEFSPTDRLATLSIGVACAPTGAQVPAEDLVVAADTALYAAKQQGRARIVAATPALLDAASGEEL